MKIAFIGYGNMANALVSSILLSKNINLTSDIYIFHNKNKDEYKLEKCKFLQSGQNCKNNFDIIFLCVKPKDMKKAIKENSHIFLDNQTIISVAAGVTINSIKGFIEKNVFIARAMPNLCAIFNESITGLCMQNTIEENKKDLIENIFKNIGYVRKINENEMHSFTALYGSGPAYIMYFIESLIDCENFDSITNDDKSLLILQLLNSTSKLLLTTKDISELRSKVTSKGGTTESAIKILEQNNFSKILEKAIQSARKKSIDLSK